MSTVVNPAIPYVGLIPGGVTHGLKIIVQGKVPHHHDNFQVDFSTGPGTEPKSDSCFTFNPRFNERCVVRNSLQYGSWGTEERHGGLPFQKGVPFEITFQVKHDVYKVAVNGRHFIDYRHRMPKESVQYLMILGGVEISFIKYEPEYPMGYAPPPMPSAGYPGSPVFNPPTPYLINMPGGLYPGRMIFISGYPRPNASRFSVNLQCGPHESNDVGFVFDARFNFGGKSNATVRNHKVGNVWGTEETHGSYFPFLPNSPFDMIILVDPMSVKVAVNNQHFCEFGHRIQPISRIDWLNITGDVQLTSVRVQ
ncbi:galectin-4-like [Gigantopelta aegis]|uniref:galectin-4-like n=1 Tax=Gigantopelta aegis TaxID=1735272 RepID=UPI001B88847D|nr:galectin-4-like [Gigantopelta aegis]